MCLLGSSTGKDKDALETRVHLRRLKIGIVEKRKDKKKNKKKNKNKIMALNPFCVF